MSNLLNLTIDGRKLQAEEGKTVLEVARDNGIDIPTLCYNEELEPYGACRLCLVEVTKGTRSRLVTSCLYPIEEGLVVKTGTEKVIANRKMLMELLLARCQGVKAIEDMAKKIGVDRPSFKPEYWEKNECILCGLCVRACAEVVGTSAISLVNRGVNREVAAPYPGDGQRLHRLRLLRLHLSHEVHQDGGDRRHPHHRQLEGHVQDAEVQEVREELRTGEAAGLLREEAEPAGRLLRRLPRLPLAKGPAAALRTPPHSCSPSAHL